MQSSHYDASLRMHIAFPLAGMQAGGSLKPLA